MPNHIFRKRKRKQDFPHSEANKQFSESLRQKESTLTIFSTILATIAAIISVWVAYRQFQLQEIQTTMQIEQATKSIEQGRIHALKDLPVLSVKRNTINYNKGISELEVCGSISDFQMISGFNAFWLSEIGRYKIPDHLSKIQQIRLVLFNENDNDDRPAWYVNNVNSMGKNLGELTSKRCAVVSEPNWNPISKFVLENRSAPKGFAYWHKSEAMVIVHQRDKAGTVYFRHYIFFHENPAEAQLVTEAEGVQWISEYENANKMRHQANISGPTTNLDFIHSFFH